MKGVRSFADRVLRLKAKQDALGEDIKEVYAEAKAARLDKTAMGQLVAYLRKREKGKTKFADCEAIFAAYLLEYDRGTDHAREDTHAHESKPLPPHDEDGVIIEEPETEQSVTVGEVSRGPVAPSPSPIPESDAQHEATFKPTSPMPAASISPASSQEPCTHGSGAVQDRCESTAPTISEAAGKRPFPSMSPETCEPAPVLAASTGEQQCETMGVTAGETAPIPQPAAGLTTPADALAVERIPPDVATAGAPFEYPALPANLDRRPVAA